jgi:hypothetical protein
MTVPFLGVFSAGQILTSDDMNETGSAVNGLGLFIVKTQTVGNAVSSVTVTGAFSSDFNSYKIIYEGGSSSASATQLQMQLGGITASVYYSSGMQQLATSATVVTTNSLAVGAWFLGYTGNQTMRFEMDFSNPNAVGSGKVGNTKFASYDSTASYGGTRAHQAITSAGATSFTFTPSTGTLTGGTIRVYGYRNSYS